MNSFFTDMVSEPGGRECNEDRCNFLIRNGKGCWVVADGLGGHGGGETAAELVADTVLSRFSRNPAIAPEALSDYLSAANSQILQAQKDDLGRMASTAVVLLADGEKALWGHVGDSRLYYFRQGASQLLTKDHSVAQALVDAGEIEAVQLRFHPDRGSLRRSLGRDGALQLSMPQTPLRWNAGDAFLLCSDGFWEYTLEVEMEIELARARDPGEWLSGMVRRLKERATGDYDNYSAVAVMVANGLGGT